MKHLVLKTSNITPFCLNNLSDDQKAQIDEAIKNTSEYVKAGTLLVPVVSFKIENDSFKEFPEDLIGKVVKYGIYMEDDKYITIKPRRIFIGDKETAGDQEVLSITEYNDYTCGNGEFVKVSGIQYHSEATHAIEYTDYTSTYLSAFVPADYDTQVAFNYVQNEMSSNRRYVDKEEPEYSYRVVRFKRYNKVRYYAMTYEHNYKNDCCMMVHRLLFMEIDEKDVEYVEI